MLGGRLITNRSAPSTYVPRYIARGAIAAAMMLAAAAPTGATTPAPPDVPNTQPAIAPPLATPATNPAGESNVLPWLDNLPAATAEAQRLKQPILVDVGAEWCGWCKLLDKEVATPAVQAKLAGWTRVKLDADKDTDATRTLAVGPIPALRILTPLGRVVTTHDGFLKADALIALLDKHHDAAAGADAVVLGDPPADPAAAEALVTRLADPDAVVREAVTRRLLARPDVAAAKVVDAFAAGKLAGRLAALELLHEWKAPLDGLDPWEPASVTPARIEALKRWADTMAKKAAGGPTSRPAGLTDAALAAARRDIASLLAAATDGEARAARERLARSGSALLPEVAAALKNAAADRDRQRLTALRYRLAASDALALGWPDGFDRLASADGNARHQAVDELGGRAKAADAPLLLELFTDPDPLVRETSLRLLQAMGSEGTTSGLVKLLRDPEPNVRAAVLKQLAETPVAGMEGEVIKFAKEEKDADLVVHAVRLMRESKTKASGDALMGLLSHESWRVRAEAAEALGKVVDRTATDERKADVYAAMIKLLDDPDGFVVSRAMGVLKDADVTSALEPLVAAADKRPDVAPEVARILAKSGGYAAAKYLRKFSTHADATVRAAAISGLMASDPGGSVDQLKAALQDQAPAVRLAAAEGTTAALDNLRPDPDKPVGGFLGLTTPKKRDMEAWLTGFRAGQGRPDWLNDAAGPLELVLGGELPGSTADERLAAAVPLIAIGKDDKALPLIQQAANGEFKAAGGRHAAMRALPWLPAEPRVALFKVLAPQAGKGEVSQLVREMAKLPSVAATGPLWDVLGSPGADASAVSDVKGALERLYLGEQYYNRSNRSADGLKALADAAAEKFEKGTDTQRLAALALLAEMSPKDALAPAEKLVKDRKPGDPLRTDAFQVVLIAKGDAGDDYAGLKAARAAGEAAAVAALDPAGDGDWNMRKIALQYLCFGARGIYELRGSIYLSINSVSLPETFGEGQPVVIEAPAGLKPEMVRPMLKDTDSSNAAAAGYLLCVLGDRSGLDPLVKRWREEKQRDDEWRKLVYRAVAALNDDALVPVLEEVYKSFGTDGRYEVRDFYWTIRGMKGPNILKLRKTVRDEVGMEQLR